MQVMIDDLAVPLWCQRVPADTTQVHLVTSGHFFIGQVPELRNTLPLESLRNLLSFLEFAA